MTRTERTYYLVFGLYSLWAWFIVPIYPLFLRSRGLDALEANLICAIYLIVVFLFEVPTGAMADLLGRKRSFLIACALRALAFALYAMADGFADCAVAEVVDGIGTTFATGALDAWAVDGMRAEGERRPIDFFFARAQVLARLGMIAGGLACAYLAVIDFALPWWIVAGGFVSTGVAAAVAMHEPRNAATTAPTRGNVYATMRDGFAAVRSAPVLVLVCALTAGSYAAAVPALMLWQTRLTELSGEGVWLVGWVWVGLNLAALAGSALLPPLLGRMRRERVLCASASWRGASLGVAAASTSFLPALGGWLLQEVSFGLSEPVMQAWMNEHVGAERRATVLSFRSMAGTLGGGVGLVAIGFVARDHGIPAAWAASAALHLAAAPLYLRLGRYRPAAPLEHVAELADPMLTPKVAPPA
jgi:MFS family permease